MRLPRIALPLLCLLALGARAAAAQEIRSPFRYIERTQSVGAFASYLWTDATLALTDTSGAELGPQSAPLFGVRYQARFSGPLSGGLSVGFSPTERKVLLAEPVTRDSTEIRVIDTGRTASVSLLLAEADIVFHLTGPRTWNGLAPFLGGTGGIALDLGGSGEGDVPRDEQYDFGPTFAVGLRLGTDWFPTQRFSVRAEAQGRIWRLSAPDGFRSQQQTDPIREWASVSGISVGGAFHF